jgi:hypothetical protein
METEDKHHHRNVAISSAVDSKISTFFPNSASFAPKTAPDFLPKRRMILLSLVLH